MSFVEYKVKEKEVTDICFGKKIRNRKAVIVEKYTDDFGVVVEIPSCLNKLLVRFRNKSINNAKNLAEVICPFLNFVKLQIIEENDPKFNILIQKGIYGLNFYHASKYLNYCIMVKEIKRITAIQYTQRILEFYENLIDLGVLDKNEVEIKYNFITIEKVGRKKIYRENPFMREPYVVCYPSKNQIKLNKIVNMEEHLWQLFLQTSEIFAPDITLGIAFQMFGGVRRGEIVNLSIQDIIPTSIIDKNKINIKIQDRSKEFFELREKVEISKCGVKKTRLQQVINFNGRLNIYYENHLKLRDKILKKSGQVTTALFIDENGLPMSGVRYEQRWAKVKKEFLKALNLNAYRYYTELSENNAIWGTHIGRGIFTNLCLKYGLAKNARELANLRGDTYVYSSQPYIDKFNLVDVINNSLNNLGE
ncbi:hypothetical protein [Inconstantimicrobium mannanitabidum]|uniref:Uncharacterized protein n=1 Tax=Inconstantimicrobium mannanitabidum TaxID=1604901 RepID=A0ACB5RCD0_9CLOT|nr:hypothetical protein [Clostridium sp. TW13]GKX66903.1 hypothetical protein rsdtw13_21610 [Clostridium sp. TW13]